MSDAALLRAAADAFVKASSGPARVVFVTHVLHDATHAFRSIRKTRDDANPEYWAGIKFSSLRGAEQIDFPNGGQLVFRALSSHGVVRGLSAHCLFLPSDTPEHRMEDIGPVVAAFEAAEVITY